MSKNEKENWLMNIEACATHVGNVVGYETVNFILKKYGANSIEELDPSDYAEVFGELYVIEVELEE